MPITAKRSDMAQQPLWQFRRKLPDGQLSTLVGAEQRADSAEDAMRRVKLIWGMTAKDGWYAEIAPEPSEPGKPR